MKHSIYKTREELPMYLTVMDVADLLGISRASAYELVREQNFPKLKIVTGRIIIPRDRLLEWLDEQTRYRKLKIILKHAGLPLIRFHDLRHTFATHATHGGVDPKTLAGILGHTNASFTLDTYTHVTSDMQKAASNIVGNIMQNIMIKE